MWKIILKKWYYHPAIKFIQDASQLLPETASKWDFQMLKMKYEQMEISSNTIFAQIKDIIIKALITIQPHICNKLSKTGTPRNQCFDLFGFDVLIDESLKPWLLEVNMSPSLSCSAKLDKQIKHSLLCDTFHLIGIQSFLHTESYKAPGTKKQEKEYFNSSFDPFVDDLYEDTELNDKDLEMLIELDEENQR